VYAMACIVIGVSAFHGFVGSFDTKTLIACAVLMLVVYETTVLLKLWLATAALKMSVLKDVKLLRLEVARLATATGAERGAEPTAKYEPMRGASPMERKLWIVACMIVAIATSSWTAHQFGLGGNWVSDETLITLSADGSVTSATELAQPYSSFHRPKDYPFFAPKEHKLRFVDPQGNDMPVKVVPGESHDRHEVTLTKEVFSDDGTMRHTRISDVPKAAKFEDGVWTYRNDIMYGTKENRFSITVCLPPGAEVVSVEPTPTLEMDQEGRTTLRFQGERGSNEKFAYAVRYTMPD